MNRITVGAVVALLALLGVQTCRERQADARAVAWSTRAGQVADSLRQRGAALDDVLEAHRGLGIELEAMRDQLGAEVAEGARWRRAAVAARAAVPPRPDSVPAGCEAWEARATGLEGALGAAERAGEAARVAQGTAERLAFRADSGRLALVDTLARVRGSLAVAEQTLRDRPPPPRGAGWGLVGEARLRLDSLATPEGFLALERGALAVGAVLRHGPGGLGVDRVEARIRLRLRIPLL